MMLNAIKRVHFQEGQTLRAADLIQEQACRIAANHRHNIGPHSWGTARGLGLLSLPSEGPAPLTVQKGIAIDGYGRMLVLPEAVDFSAATIRHMLRVSDADGSYLENVAVWLVYKGYPLKANPARWIDDICVTFTPGPARKGEEPGGMSARGTVQQPYPPPYGVPVNDLDYRPQDIVVGNEPTRSWPVFLGWITLRGDTIIVNSDDRRPYVTFTGGLLTSPSRLAQIRLEASRIAVSISNEAFDRFALDYQAGHASLTFKGNVSVVRGELPSDATAENQNIKVIKKALLPERLGFTPLTALPKQAMPDHVYRVDIPAGTNQPQVSEWRIELNSPDKEGRLKNAVLEVGQPQRVDDKTLLFDSCFTVQADKVVRIKGNLHVSGEIYRVPPQTTADAGSLAGSGTSSGGGALDIFTKSALSLTILPPAAIKPNQANTAKVSVRNTGQTTFSSVTLYPSSDPAALVSPAPMQNVVSDLAPGASQDIDLPTFTPSPNQTFTIKCGAVGMVSGIPIGASTQQQMSAQAN